MPHGQGGEISPGRCWDRPAPCKPTGKVSQGVLQATRPGSVRSEHGVASGRGFEHGGRPLGRGAGVTLFCRTPLSSDLLINKIKGFGLCV